MHADASLRCRTRTVHAVRAAAHGLVVTALRATVFAVLLVSACGEGGRPAPVAGARTAQNVLLIVMDTTRADRCSVHGAPRPTTPGLTALGREGVVFDRTWASSSWTVPTHATMFTGLLPQRHRADTDGANLLEDRQTTLAEILTDAQFATGAWSNNPFVSAGFGFPQGFGTFVALFRERNVPKPAARATHDLALAWIRKQEKAGRRWFAFVNDMEPHAPFEPPDDVARRFVAADVTAEELAWGRSYGFPQNLRVTLGLDTLPPERLQLLSDLYDAEIATLDAEIARLVEALRADGVLDETLVIVVGDHGEHLGENGLLSHCLSLHDALLHVPLVIRCPGWFEGGRRVADIARLEDLLPTILEVTGLPPRADLDGRSLLHDLPGRPALARLGRPSGILEAAARVAPDLDVTRHDVVLESAYDGRYHLVRCLETGAERLYEPEADPREERDVAAHHPDVVARLRALIESARSPQDAARAAGPR